MTDTKFLARTAASVALVVLAQLLGKVLPAGAVIAGPFSVTQLVTGSLVNCVLLSAAGINGVWSGVIVGLISPVLAFFLGIGPRSSRSRRSSRSETRRSSWRQKRHRG